MAKKRPPTFPTPPARNDLARRLADELLALRRERRRRLGRRLGYLLMLLGARSQIQRHQRRVEPQLVILEPGADLAEEGLGGFPLVETGGDPALRPAKTLTLQLRPTPRACPGRSIVLDIRVTTR